MFRCHIHTSVLNSWVGNDTCAQLLHLTWTCTCGTHQATRRCINQPLVAPTSGSSGPVNGRRTGSISVPSASKNLSSNQLPKNKYIHTISICSGVATFPTIDNSLTLKHFVTISLLRLCTGSAEHCHSHICMTNARCGSDTWDKLKISYPDASDNTTSSACREFSKLCTMRFVVYRR